MTPETKGPFFVTPYADAPGGVDYLGIRVVNFALMDEFLPSINNVTRSIRPYAVMTWAAWAFREAKKALGQTDATRAEFESFREKVEVLFGWGHQIEGTGIGLVGNAQELPEDVGPVPLSFAAWGRNVSWLDAVYYGPSLKTDNGLGLIAQVLPGVFAATTAGEHLAEALDRSLKQCGRYAELRSLENKSGTADLAKALYPYWMIGSPSKHEADAFCRAFYQPDTAGDKTRLGRRSAAVSLVVWALEQQKAPVRVPELRRYMTLYEVQNGSDGESINILAPMQGLWRVLQVRQAQRLSAETLFGWIEIEILERGRRLSSQIVEDLMDLLARSEDSGAALEHWLSEELSNLARIKSDSDSLLEAAKTNEAVDIFVQMAAIEVLLGEDIERAAVLSLKLLILCAELTQELEGDVHSKPHLGRGGAARISLLAWKTFVVGSVDLPLQLFLTNMVENYFLSQHFGIAAARYTEGKQRLRITIEEGGLVSMLHSADDAWHPIVTRDRLAAALSLMADGRMVTKTAEDETELYSVRRPSTR